MYTINMVADLAKAKGSHKLAAATAKPLNKHVLKNAPSGAHAHVLKDIPAGPYTVEQVEAADGSVGFVLTPGVVA